MTEKTTHIAILLFENFDVMDVSGPYEVLRWLPHSRISLVGTQRGPVRSEGNGLALVADSTLEQVAEPDVVIVPGGSGERAARDDARILAWLRSAQARGAWVVSVCTGALLLGAAGLLRGKRATTYWMATGELAKFGATFVNARYVIDGRLVTSAGVSAGIDMAIALAAELRSREVAEAISLGIEYDPRPPFPTGSPERAPAELVQRLRSASRFKQSA